MNAYTLLFTSNHQVIIANDEEDMTLVKVFIMQRLTIQKTKYSASGVQLSDLQVTLLP